MAVRVAIAGLGNCASALVQGIDYYKNFPSKSEILGRIHVLFGNHYTRDVKFSAAFKVNKLKIGKTLSETISTESNCVRKLCVIVLQGCKKI